jgi:hypothetical protein
VVFVEAAIIVCTMTLFFLAIIFFRNFYERQISTAHLARGAALAHSMGGCEENEPRAWIARDLGGKQPSSSSDDNPVPKEAVLPSDQGSDRANGIMRSLPAAGSDDSFLNPIAQVGLATRSSVTTRDGLLGPRRGFEREVRARSHVSCGDLVREGDFEEIVDVVTGFFNEGDDEGNND